MINRDQSDWNAPGPRLSDIFKEHADKVAFVRETAKSRSQKWLAQLTLCAARESITSAWSRPACFQTISPPQGTVLALVVAWTIE